MKGKGQARIYCIRVEGQLDDGWSAWFTDLVITPRPDGTTTICGGIEDQGALHGILERARDLNVNLLSVDSAPDAAGIGECRVCRALYRQGAQTKGGS